MEIIKIMGILISESIKGLWNIKFDTVSFWNRCIQVNILYTKFFQSLSGNYFFSSVHTIPYFPEEFEPTLPVTKVIGSGLISIVYESELDNCPVVVKTKRKHIDERILSSIESLKWYLEWLNWIYPIPICMIAFDEIKSCFLVQLNYRQEVQNHKHFQSIAKYPFIQTPTLIESVCNETQIVMTKLNHKPLVLLTEDELHQSIWKLTEMVLHLLTHHGFIHGDLHLGNILFQGDVLGIVDFGFVIQLNESQKKSMYELVKGLIFHDYESAANHTFKFIQHELTESEKIDVQHFIIHVYQQSMEIQHSFSIYNFYELNTKLNQYDATFDPLFYKIIMSLHSVETLISKITNPDELAVKLALLLCAQS
jgi:predicted unusual protein kinase regulating ubiquinone biosynthesis (AarF/ABC1/UbiB family)